MNFQSKYNQLPGDAPSFGGDGDKVLDVTASSGSYDDYNVGFISEIANFWAHMFPEEYTRVAYGLPGARPVSSGVGKNVPLSKLGKDKSYIIANSIGISATTADKTNPRNFYIILDPIQAQLPGILSSYVFTATTINKFLESLVETRRRLVQTPHPTEVLTEEAIAAESDMLKFISTKFTKLFSPEGDSHADAPKLIEELKN